MLAKEGGDEGAFGGDAPAILPGLLQGGAHQDGTGTFSAHGVWDTSMIKADAPLLHRVFKISHAAACFQLVAVQCGVVDDGRGIFFAHDAPFPMANSKMASA